MNNVIFQIRQQRELKGFSQEFVAEQLNITQSSYAKLESGSVKMTLKRLQEITDVLEIDINKLINSNKQPIFNIYDNDNAIGQKIVDNLYEYNKETIDLLLKEKDKRIKSLEDEVLFLRERVR